VYSLTEFFSLVSCKNSYRCES